tara:strand:+ start:291 stop:605 length:315 start_codon:yes stop_codon:yes gene_type:complete
MADEQVDEVEVEDAPVEDAPVEDPNALQASDLNTMATVLEAVASRGAVRANEMELVGALYNKLMGFLVANGLRPAPGAENAAPETGTGEAEAVVEDASGEAEDA